MDRRSLLKLFLTLPGIIPALGRAIPKQPDLPDIPYPIPETCRLGIEPDRSSTLQIQESPVAGFWHYQGDTVWPQLELQDELRLVREPDNPHDGNAVEIYWHRHKLGYLPRRENKVVAGLLDQGIALSARITKLRETENPWDRVRLSVELLNK